jgi:hypothetical protein
MFSADKVPDRIDQSSATPGPGGAAANRAGYTSVKFEGKGVLKFVSDLGPVRSDGMVPFYFLSVKIVFRLTDFSVKVSSDYPAGSCVYKVTVQHELDAHIRAPIVILYGYRGRLIARLNRTPLPTKQAPRWIKASDAVDVQKSYEDQVHRIVGDVRGQVAAALKKDRTDQDSPANYNAIYEKCPDVEWNRGR